MEMDRREARNSKDAWFEQVPKVELHLHLEGAIPDAVMWELMRKYGGDPLVPDVAALRNKFVYRDFTHFIETWIWHLQFLREYDDFSYFAAAVASDLARQNIRYVEAFFSPSDFARHNLEPQRLTEAIRAGLDRVPAVQVALIADLVRDRGPENAAITLAQLREVQHLGLIGIGIGGSEDLFPPEVFAPVYAEARRLGFRTTAHAGEAAGAASIWGAIRELHAERIGHATRAEEDARLVDYIVEHRIPLELCPLSNVRTGVVRSIGEHPARRYFERGLLVSINTDDPRMFGNSLAEEYRLLQEQLGFSRDDIRALILNGIESAWLDQKSKRQLIDTFTRDPAWLGRYPLGRTG